MNVLQFLRGYRLGDQCGPCLCLGLIHNITVGVLANGFFS
jgi:hypothetical protein